MKKLLLFTAISSITLCALAEESPTPIKIENANAYAMSANGEYLVATGMTGGAKIYNLEKGESYDYTIEENGAYEAGIAKNVSDNGIVVGFSDATGCSYWSEGKWYRLKAPMSSTGSSTASAITSDGRRICGSAGYALLSEGDDNLMSIPVIWTWDEAKGDFGTAVILPYPERDFTNRIPQYVKAVDISADGKTVIGQVRTATGFVHYPIVFTENEAGEWSYQTLFDDKILPEGLSFPEYPGENPTVLPKYEDYMTPAQLQAYLIAYDQWEASGFTSAYPELWDYMDPEQYNAYEKALAKAQEIDAIWYNKFLNWMDVLQQCQLTWSDFEFNSIRISSDGKTFANTMLVPGEPNYEEGILPVYRNIWVFDIDGNIKAKYDQDEDFTLTCLADGGVAFATTTSSGQPQAYVLADGKCTVVDKWITDRVPSYKAWIEDNLTFGAEIAGPDGGTVFDEFSSTGRAYATPDLSKIALGIENFWDFNDDGLTCVFDMMEGNSVSTMRPGSDGETSVYDLNVRRLKNAEAPGIYIINGKKTVVH